MSKESLAFLSGNKWQKTIKKNYPNLVSIKTSKGIGTGCLIFYNSKTDYACVLTAYHVVKLAHKLEGSDQEFEDDTVIELFNHSSKVKIVLPENERTIIKSKMSDIALIVFRKSDFSLIRSINLIEQNLKPELGMEVGLISLVSLESFSKINHKNNINISNDFLELVFFNGNINLILGNFICTDFQSRPGMSGSPVFVINKKNEPFLVGVVASKLSDSDNFLKLTHICLINDMLEDLNKIIYNDFIIEFTEIYKKHKDRNKKLL